MLNGRAKILEGAFHGRKVTLFRRAIPWPSRNPSTSWLPTSSSNSSFQRKQCVSQEGCEPQREHLKNCVYVLTPISQRLSIYVFPLKALHGGDDPRTPACWKGSASWFIEQSSGGQWSCLWCNQSNRRWSPWLVGYEYNIPSPLRWITLSQEIFTSSSLLVMRFESCISTVEGLPFDILCPFRRPHRLYALHLLCLRYTKRSKKNSLST